MAGPSHVDVTVIIPAYNRAHLIQRALDSVAAQTTPPREVIVVDDASTDDTVRLARAGGATVLTSRENCGSGPARSRGVDSASTSWVAFLDSDDTWAVDHLETLWSQRGGEAVLVCASGHSSDGRFFGNPHGGPLSLTPRLVLESSELVVTSAVMVRKEALVRAGLFRPLRRAQDLDMWLRVLELGPGVALPNPTVTYHVHDQQVSLDSELTRACFDEIVETSESRGWFDARRGRDRIYVRRHWDDLRLGQRERNLRDAGRHAAWIVARPHSWPALATLLRARRGRRARSRPPARVVSTHGRP